MLGAVLNANNVRLDAGTIAYILDHGEAKVLLVDTEYSALAAKAVEQSGRDRHQDIQRPVRQPGASLPEVLDFFKQAPKLMTRRCNHQPGTF